MNTKDIGIFDRAYGSYNLIAEMVKQNKHFVIRCQRSSFIEVQELYESNDPILSKVVTLRPAYKNLGKIKKTTLPDKVMVRLLKLTLSNNEPEVLVTSLIDEQVFSIEDIDRDLSQNSSSKGIKQQKINKAVSFNAIKAKAFDLFYYESDHVKIIDELTAMFLLNKHCVRLGRTAPRLERSGYKKWRFHKYIKKHVF